ncbi:MAG: hypothetical protein LBQ77_04715 [Treponema sp.]|jgi:hypothetical protein|nr:hypothetical protein [Treponema sp.]
MKIHYLILIICLTVCSYGYSFPTNRTIVPGEHQGTLNALTADSRGYIFSAGADGFLGIWDSTNRTIVDRFQLSAYPIYTVSLNEKQSSIAVVNCTVEEMYEIAVWNYSTKEQLWSRIINKPVSFLSYSADYSFLIIAGNTFVGVVLLNAETGEQLNAPQINVPVRFAATGNSAKTMLIYASETLSYWNVGDGTMLQQVPVPSALNSPLLFGNNRFLAGIHSSGLMILDAVSGSIIAHDSSITSGLLVPGASNSMECISIAQEHITRIRIHQNGMLEKSVLISLPHTIPTVTAAFPVRNVSLALGTASGTVWLLRQNGDIHEFTTWRQQKIKNVTVLGTSLVFLTETGFVATIPVDFHELDSQAWINGEYSLYTELCAGPVQETGYSLLFWSPGTTRSFPILKFIDSFGFDTEIPLSTLSLRFPLRSVSTLGSNALFLDSMGTIQIISLVTGEKIGSYTIIGARAAAFLDEENLIIGRETSIQSPFLYLNMVTGETVPVYYPANLGSTVYIADDGTTFAAAVDERQTSLLRLQPWSSHDPVVLAQYPLTTALNIAVVGGNLAIMVAENGAYLSKTGARFGRTESVPIRLINGKSYFITVNADGSIAWFEPDRATLVAQFYLYNRNWILEKGEISISGFVETNITAAGTW